MKYNEAFFVSTVAGFSLLATASGNFAAGENFVAWLVKNGLHGTGTDVLRPENQTTVSTLTSSVASCTYVAMNGSTDTLEADVSVSGAGSVNVVGTSNILSTMSGVLVAP